MSVAGRRELGTRGAVVWPGPRRVGGINLLPHRGAPPGPARRGSPIPACNAAAARPARRSDTRGAPLRRGPRLRARMRPLPSTLTGLLSGVQDVDVIGALDDLLARGRLQGDLVGHHPEGGGAAHLHHQMGRP